MWHLKLTLSQWDALSKYDKAWALATQRTLDRMDAYEKKLQADELERLKVRK